ncbi:MAG: hypothetical protein OXL34_03985 [Gemmatimonadota bacterium]|nr:hypothetical protein [Gemmatimonadota bacterium]
MSCAAMFVSDRPASPRLCRFRTPGGSIRCILAAGAIATSACSESSPANDWASVRDTLPSGVERVTNTPPPQTATTWTLVEEIRVGTVEADRPESFGEIKGLVGFEGGGFAVLESQSLEIRVFAADGSHLATHGQRGEGPGEFIGANGLMLDPSGRIWVPDSYAARMSVLDPEDGFVESFPFTSFVRGWVWTGAMTADGRILKHSSTTMRVFDSTMTELPSLSLPPAPEGLGDEDPSIFLVESATGWEVRAVPFYPGGATTFAPSGAMWSAAVGDPSHRVHKWMPGGDTMLVVETQRPPLPVTSAERDSVIADTRAWFRERGVETEADWSRIPDVKPAVIDLVTSAEGNLWVQTPSPGGGVGYDVLAPDGAYLGSTAPAALETVFWLNPVIRGDYYWTVVFDELDVPYVVRAKLTPVE